MDNWFIEHLERHGWEIVEKQIPSARGIKGVWKVFSIWTPKNLEVYFVFEVDPQDDPEDIHHTTWVYAFIDPPWDWLSDDKESLSSVSRLGSIASTTLGRHREKYIGEFFEKLHKIRLNRS